MVCDAHTDLTYLEKHREVNVLKIYAYVKVI